MSTTRWFLALLLALAPAARASDLTVLGSLARDATVAPGDRHAGEIVVRNNTGEAIRLLAYQKDYRFQADGSNVYGEPGRDPRSNAGWMTVAPAQVEVPAHGTSSVYYTVDVPADPTLVGSYWSLVLIEPVGPPADPGAPVDGGTAITAVTRYGVQVAVHVGKARPMLTFADAKLHADDDRPGLWVDLANTGEVLLRPQVWADVYAADGTSAGRLDAAPLRLYPSCSGRYRFDLSALPAGRYTAVVIADAADSGVFGAEYDLDLR